MLKGVFTLKCFYITIEKSIESFELYRKFWKARNVEGVRAGTMTEGIKKAIEIEKSGNNLYFISIVADDVNYMPQLKVLSGATNAPLLIAVSEENYSVSEHHKALKNGADFYAPYCAKDRHNITGVLSVIESVNQRAKKQKSSDKIIIHDDILIDSGRHIAFFCDKEISLTGAEMRILHYMMLNRDIVLCHDKFFQNTYTDYDEATSDSLYSAMKRLRKKIRTVAHINYIETVKGVGYRLRTKSRE
jgi:DNA-binding response OmpR family regulator